MSEMKAQIERLSARRRLGIKPGLKNERLLLDVLGHPEQSFAAVHVAGTNGKGSVAAMVASVLRQAGYRVGLFTSPHLVHLNERFQVDGAMVNDATLVQLMDRIEQAAQTVDAEQANPVTFFECTAAMAFEHFRACGVQVAVVETGMGGRLDATNVLTPAVSVVTRIAMDHAAYLGDDVAAVAREKGGIIKPGRPVVIGAMPDEARDVLRSTAQGQGAFFRDAAESVSISVRDMSMDGLRAKVTTSSGDYPVLSMPLVGEHQAENLALAVAVCETLRDEVALPLSDDAIVEGLRTTRWNGRLQVLQRDPPLLLDGAHNPDAARALVRSLKRLFKKRPIGMVVGMCADKDIRTTLRELAVLAPKVWTVPLSVERGMASGDLRECMVSLGMNAEDGGTLSDALNAAVRWAAQNDGMVCVAGSLFLVGDVLCERGVDDE